MLSESRWLVTGGTGSLGSHLVRRILDTYDPLKVVVYARDAGRHVAMAREVKDKRVRYILGDVRDEKRITSAMQGIDYVVHAAAQKHIDLGEYNPTETHDINVNGTVSVANACIASMVDRAVLISTDKAVEPLNVYGVSKAAAERLWLGRGIDGANVFSVARYGNVINSEGAIIPFWKTQIRHGCRVLEVTDEASTRFAMTFDMALDLIEEALTGPPQAIYCAKAKTFSLLELADVLGALINRSGLRVAEKKHEVLISQYEANRARDCGTHYVIRPEVPADSEMRYDTGFPMPPGVEYASNTAGIRMCHDELLDMIGGTDGAA
jgi:UDP-N-acetylglucosamine 4,6-dehydratase